MSHAWAGAGEKIKREAADDRRLAELHDVGRPRDRQENAARQKKRQAAGHRFRDNRIMFATQDEAGRTNQADCVQGIVGEHLANRA